MKIFRSLAAILSVFALGHLATAQESSEVASLRAKAEKGNGIAQYNLGLAYADGKGIARDPIEAYVWLSLARESGARGRALDNVGASLDKASLELARQRIAERKATLGKTPGAPAATAKPATPAPAIVVENQPATPSPTGSTGSSTAEDPVIARLRKERDAYSTKVGEIAADLFTVRTERDRLAEQSAEIQRNTQAVSAASLGLQEQARAAEARAAELARAAEATAAELARTKQELAALAALSSEATRAKQEAMALLKAKEDAPQPVPATAALVAKTRELQTALTELDAARQFGRKVEDTLNQVNDEKTRAAAELEAARQFGQQVEATLNKVNDQKTALETQLATLGAEANRAKQEIAALTQAKEAAKPAGPAYPDLRVRVTELESQFAALSADATRAKQEMTALAKAKEDAQAAAKARAEELARAKTKLAGDETAFAAVNRELAEARASLAQTNQALAALSTEATRAKQEIVALTKAKEDKPATPKYPDLTGRVTELESALVAARKAAPAYPDLRTNVAALEEQLTALSTEAGRVKQENAALAKAKEDAMQALATKPAAPGYPDLRQQVGELETKLAATEKALTAKPAAPSYPDLSGRVHELEAVLAAARTAAAPAAPDLSGRVSELEAALADTSRQLAALSAEATRAKPAVPVYPDLSGRVSELEAAVAASIQKFGAAEQARVEVTRQFDDYKSATAAAQRERITLQASLKMLESDKAALRRQVEAATTESNQLRTQVAALKTQAAALRPATPGYPDLSGKVAQLESALAARPAAPSYPDLSGRVGELETALAALGSEANRAKQEIAALSEAKEAARNASPAYPDLSGRVGVLESQLAKANTELSAVGAAKADLSGKVAQLESALAAKPAAPSYPDLSGRVHELETALAALGSEANRAKQEIAALNEAKEAARNSAPAYPDLSGRVNELTAEVTQLRTDRERMQKLLADSGRQLAEATAAARSRPVAPSGNNDRVRELEAALAQAKAAPAAPAYPDLTGEVTQLRADRERMQKMLADAGRQLRDNTADTARIKELETQLAGLSAETRQTKQEILALTKAREDAQAQTGGLTSERDALSAEAARAKQDVAALTQAKEDARNMQQELRDTITRLEREKAQLAAARPSPTPAHPDLSGRVSELESALAAAKQQLAQAPSAATPTGDTSGLEQKLADTEDRLATALRGYAALQRERDTLEENAGKSAAAVTAERDTLASQVASLTGQVEQLRASAQNSSGSTQAELARLNEAVAVLQRTTAQSTQDAAAARALAQQLQGANAVLAGENYQLKTMLARSVGGPAPATATVATPAARTHVVVAGDSLSRLSQRYYGSAGRWQEIYNANVTLLGPNGVLRVGTELRIP